MCVSWPIGVAFALAGSQNSVAGVASVVVVVLLIFALSFSAHARNQVHKKLNSPRNYRESLEQWPFFARPQLQAQLQSRASLNRLSLRVGQRPLAGHWQASRQRRRSRGGCGRRVARSGVVAVGRSFHLLLLLLLLLLLQLLAGHTDCWRSGQRSVVVVGVVEESLRSRFEAQAFRAFPLSGSSSTPTTDSRQEQIWQPTMQLRPTTLAGTATTTPPTRVVHSPMLVTAANNTRTE